MFTLLHGLALLGLAIFPFLLQSSLRTRKRPLPPGPKGLPVLGNILEVRSTS